ncbi:hypothetical protein GCM10022225_83870 [Plantactinospora mayteni]
MTSGNPLASACHSDPMRPNLERIPGKADRLAEAIIDRAPFVVDHGFVDSLGDAAAAALRCYGARMVTFAYREDSIGLVRRSLLAEGLGLCVKPDDDRDVMVGLALPWFVTQQLGRSPKDEFAAIADRLPDNGMTRLIRRFGKRVDITLGAFGWDIVETPEGADFVPTM